MPASYSLSAESKKALQKLLNDPALHFTDDVKKASEKIKYLGREEPWLPTPYKFTETISAFSSAAAAGAAVIAKERYGIDQDITVNTEGASMFLAGFIVNHVQGEAGIFSSQGIVKNMAEADKNELFKAIRRGGYNQYLCKDGKYYHTHASLNAKPLQKMLGIEDTDGFTLDEARKIYAAKVAEWDSEKLDYTSNEVYRIPGVTCYSPEEFLQTEQGKILSKAPLAYVHEVKAKRVPWPKARGNEYRPLDGIRVLDASRAVAAPAISKVLAGLGADVLKISGPTLPDTAICMIDVNAGKRDIFIDLKTEKGMDKFRSLVKDADVFVDGFRPNALAKLGINSDSLRELNGSLIHVRECCYGYEGPWAHRSGWQQIADALVGLTIVQGKFLGLNEPVQPLLPNADYQTGVLGSALIVNALLRRAKEDVTFNINLGLSNYNVWLCSLGIYDEQQQKKLRELHPNFKPTHLSDIPDIANMVVDTVRESIPGLVDNPEIYEQISGREWNEERPISIIKVPFNLSKSKTNFRVPSGRRGWSDSNPYWLPRE